MFLLLAVAAQAGDDEAVAFGLDIGAGGDQRFQLIVGQVDVGHLFAGAAVEMLMGGQFPVETVGFSRNANPADFTDVNQGVEVAVNGAEAQMRAGFPGEIIDL